MTRNSARRAAAARVFLETCEHCDGDGVYGHDCGEDCCGCLDPEENEPCDLCGGRGWVKVCSGNCDENGHRGDGG